MTRRTLLIRAGVLLAFCGLAAMGVYGLLQTAEANRNQKAIIAAQQRGVVATQQQRAIEQRRLLVGIRELLDRPVLSVKTIRRVVNRQGVRTVILTRTIFRERVVPGKTRIVYKTQIVYRYIYICRLPNGKPCPKP
jgi:hypothetical protein